MSTRSSVRVSLDVVTEQAQASLEAFNKYVLKSNTAWSTFTANLMANAASNAVGFIRDQMSQMYNKAIEEAKNAEREINSLNVALAKNGIYSVETSKSFQILADQIEATTLYTGGAILENTALLTSMTSLNEQGIARTIKAATELAATYDIELGAATEALAKASRGNTTSLQKLGLEFETSGTKAQNFESILNALEARQGTAAAKANTYEGSQKKITDSSNKVFEAIGALITQNPAVLGAMGAFAKILGATAGALETFGEWTRRNSDLLEGLAMGFATAGVALTAIAAKVILASASFTALTKAASIAWVAIPGPVGVAVASIAAVSAALYGIVKHWGAISAGAYSAMAATLEFSAKASAALGANGVAKSLEAEAAAYRTKAQEARAAYDAERAASDANRAAIENNSAANRQAIDEEAEARLKATNEWVKKLSDAQRSEEEINKRKLEAAKFAYEEQGLVELAGDEVNFQAKLDRERAYFERQREIQEEARNYELERVNQSTLSEQAKFDARMSIEQTYQAKSNQLQLDFAKKSIELSKKEEEEQRKLRQQKIAAASQLFGALADLASLGGQQSFGAFKALAVAESITAGYLAVQRTLASGPWPANAIAATAIGIQAAANTAKIVAQQPPAFASGGIVPGNSYVGDRVAARVNSGEMILNRQQQSNLFNQINTGGLGSDAIALLSEIASVLRRGQIIQIDGKQIVSVVRDGIQSGRAIA